MVPLADMLSNTVGIMLFILIFVVLTAGGATIIRYFPYEKESSNSAIYLFCAYGKFYPADLQKLRKDLFANLKKIELGKAIDLDHIEVKLTPTLVGGTRIGHDVYAKNRTWHHAGKKGRIIGCRRIVNLPVRSVETLRVLFCVAG
jgi:hypothetical protein